MKRKLKPGDKKHFKKIVGKEDLASFESGNVHPFYSTFALARDAEWTCRQFVLDIKDSNEEGIGTFVHVNHQSPALCGEAIEFEATIISIDGNEIICDYLANVGERTIASGSQGQKILKKEKLERLIEQLESKKE